ncbi:MAG: glycoside hydrolase family 3 protein [Spirochaetales bacterium]
MSFFAHYFHHARRLAVLLAVAAFTAPLSAQTPSFWDDTPDEILIEQLIEAMTPEELLAQTLLVGWEGEDPSRAVTAWIRDTNLGGVKVFGWNGIDLPRLGRAIGSMQRMAGEHRLGIPLFTATDQEGGWVRHVKGSGDLSTAITAGNMALGASRLPSDSYQTGYYIGSELRALGINMNFAPTVDVYVNPEAHVIGPRAFSSDPVQTGVLGVAFYHGLEETRVIATAKHFPGHGNAEGDSHGVLPILDETLAELNERDLVPFRFLIQEGVPAILSGHLSFPNIDGDGRPASLSRYFKKDILRDQLGFEGIVITDDLYMQGAWQFDTNWRIEDIVVEALKAGSDIVLLSRTPESDGPLWRSLTTAYDADASFAAQIHEAVRNILRVKLEYLKPENRVPLEPSLDSIRAYISDRGRASFFQDHAGRSVTVFREEELPIVPETAGRTLLVSKDQAFFRIGREFFPEADTLRLASRAFYTSTISDRRRFASEASRYDTIIFGMSDPNTVEVLGAAAGTDATLVAFSTLTPIYLYELPWIENSLAVFGSGVDSLRAGFSVLTGAIPALGENPVPLE